MLGTRDCSLPISRLIRQRSNPVSRSLRRQAVIAPRNRSRFRVHRGYRYHNLRSSSSWLLYVRRELRRSSDWLEAGLRWRFGKFNRLDTQIQTWSLPVFRHSLSKRASE
jgi:hypothetical protein